MFWANGVVSSMNSGFDVEQGCVDPFEGRVSRSLHAATSYGQLIAAADLCDRREASEHITDNGGARDQDAGAAFLLLVPAKAFEVAELETVRLALLIVLTAATEGILPPAPRPRLRPSRTPPI
jgi:hypothetical protein